MIETMTLREFLELRIAHERELREADRRHGMELREILLKDIGRRLESMNEWREQLAHERGAFVQREMFDQKFDEMIKRQSETDTRLSNIGAARATFTWLWGAALGLAGLVTALLHWLSSRVAGH
jgi:hypothetical protein